MILAVDTETTGTDFFHGCRPFMITACDGQTNWLWEGEVNPYTREVYWDDDVLNEAKEVIYEADHIVLHNTNFDFRALESVGFNLTFLWPKVEDTLIAAHAIDAAHDTGEKAKVGRSLGLKDLCLEYFGWAPDDELELEKAVKDARDSADARGYAKAKKGHPHFPGLTNSRWWKMDFWMAMEECRKYAAADVERTYLLWNSFRPALIGDSLWEVYRLRMDLMKICYEIVGEGINFDVEAADKYIEEQEVIKEELRWKLKEIGGIKYKFQPSKPRHVADLLFNCCNIPIKFTTDSGKPQLNKEALDYYVKEYDVPAINVLGEWRSRDKRAQYVRSYRNWVCDGSIHSNLNPTGTRETRQSSSSPNQQNVTAELQQFYEPEDGVVWFDADYDNIEMRIWAYSVNNPEMVQAFNEGKSIHMMVFHELFPSEAAEFAKYKDDEKYLANSNRGQQLSRLYRNIKGFNFGIIYGATEGKADDTVGVKGSYKKLINRFPEIEAFTKGLIQQVYDNIDKWGVPSIFTLGGYRLPVPIDEPFKAANYFVQGSAGIITTKGMIRIRNHEDYIDSESKMFNQVHDSIKIKIPDCRETKYLAETFKREMELAGEELIPTCTASYHLKYKAPF